MPASIPRRIYSLILHVSWILSILFLLRPAHADVITSTSPEFTLDIPARFIPVTPPPNSRYAFATSKPEDGVPDAVVSVTILPGPIGKDHMKPSDVPVPGAKITTVNWHGHDIDVITANMTKNGVTLVMRVAQVPIQHQAVQINVGVPIGKHESADEVLAEVLGGLNGPSNWDAPAPLTPWEEGARSGRFLGIAALAIIVIIILIRAAIKRRGANTGQSK